MHATASLLDAPAARPGYDPSAAATMRRVLPLLADERVVWLSTVRPDGTPHLVPAWFLWDGESLLVWSKPNAVKVRNLRANPKLMVAVGDAHADFNVGLIEAHGELEADAAIPAAFFAKYATDLADAGLDPSAFRATYTQTLRIVPTRFLAWNGRAGVPAASAHRHDAAAGSGRVAGTLAGWLDRIADRLRGPGAASPVPLGA